MLKSANTAVVVVVGNLTTRGSLVTAVQMLPWHFIRGIAGKGRLQFHKCYNISLQYYLLLLH